MFNAFGVSPPASITPRTVVATVNGQPIHADEVERLVSAAIKQRPVEPAAKEWLQAQALDQLVGQRLVEAFLTRERLSASELEVKAALDQVEADAEAARLDFAALLAQRGTTEEQLREQFRWELGWKKYLAREITDESLRKHFELHRREFDGSELRVSHILIKTAEEARLLREQIVSKQTTFAEAARRHSTSPTADQGGDLGFIVRHGAMVEEFSQPAFALQVGEVSPPVTTRFGIHLIQVTEARPGDKRWTDVREPLRVDVARRLFESISNEERPKAVIRKR